MSSALYSLFGGGVAGAVAIVVAIIRTRGADKSAQLSGKQVLDAQIDARVEAQLKDAWSRIETLENDRDFQKSAVNVLGAGFDALSGYVERLTPAPPFSPWEQDAINRAKDLRADDSLWPTGRRPVA